MRRQLAAMTATVAVALVALGAAPRAAAAVVPLVDEQLERGVGQTPPKLTDVKWIRGRKVSSYRRGNTYVLFFWATWGANSRRTVPLLDALRVQHARDRVVVVGVNIWPRAGTIPPEDFLEKREAGFALARDVNGATARAWERIIDLEQVPRAVIVDSMGEIAWAGHPFDGLDEVLPALVTKDTERLESLRAERADRHARAEPHEEMMSKAAKHEWWHRMPPAVDALLEINEQLYGPYALSKYRALRALGRVDDAARWGREALEGPLSDCETHLDRLAWSIVGPREDDAEEQRVKLDDVELALAAARRADELAGGRDWSVLDTLARAHFVKGEEETAVVLQRRAIEEAWSYDQRRTLQLRLDRYLDPESDREELATAAGHKP